MDLVDECRASSDLLGRVFHQVRHHLLGRDVRLAVHGKRGERGVRILQRPKGLDSGTHGRREMTDMEID